MKEVIRGIADRLFTSDTKWTWYDRMWEHFSGGDTLEKRK